MDESIALPDQTLAPDFNDSSRNTPGSADVAATIAEGRRKVIDRLTGVMPRTATQAQRAGSALNQLGVDVVDECRQRIRERPINAVLMGLALGMLLAVGSRNRPR